MNAERVAKKTPAKKPMSARIEAGAAGIVVHDGKPKKDKDRFPSVPLMVGDSLTLTFPNGVVVYILTKKPYTDADIFQRKLRFARLLVGRSPFVLKRRISGALKDPS